MGRPAGERWLTDLGHRGDDHVEEQHHQHERKGELDRPRGPARARRAHARRVRVRARQQLLDHLRHAAVPRLPVRVLLEVVARLAVGVRLEEHVQREHVACQDGQGEQHQLGHVKHHLEELRSAGAAARAGGHGLAGGDKRGAARQGRRHGRQRRAAQVGPG
jgi:hypothetical protein